MSWNASRRAMCCLIVAFFGIVHFFQENITQRLLKSRKELALVSFNLSDDHVCHSPQLFATIHDQRPVFREHYQRSMKQLIETLHFVNKDLPEVATLNSKDGAYFAIWDSRLTSKMSAWTEDGHVNGPRFQAPPPEANITMVRLEGDYAAYSTYLEGAYGHFAHDWLPPLAYFKTRVPSTTKFILQDAPNTRKEVQFIDPDFYKRVVWVDPKVTVHVSGSLSVLIEIGTPDVMGQRLMNYARAWIKEMHPDVPTKKHVIWYTRGHTPNKLMRVLDYDLETTMMDRVKAAMKKYGKEDEGFVVFNGHDDNGKPLSIIEQFALFRSASTVIGPHGTGIGGNMIWVNPSPKSCEDRTQLLEFVPGPDGTSIVQHPYCSHFPFLRGLPIDYHTILYKPGSTRKRTLIDLDDFDDALESMWDRSGRNETVATTNA